MEVVSGTVSVQGAWDFVMAPDKPELLQAFFTKGVFLGACPACLASHNFAPAEFTSKTIAYTCACGRSYTVLPLGLRGGQRKVVNVPGSLSWNSAKGPVRVPCLLRDISTKGVGITIDAMNAELTETRSSGSSWTTPGRRRCCCPARCAGSRKRAASSCSGWNSNSWISIPSPRSRATYRSRAQEDRWQAIAGCQAPCGRVPDTVLA